MARGSATNPSTDSSFDRRSGPACPRHLNVSLSENDLLVRGESWRRRDLHFDVIRIGFAVGIQTRSSLNSEQSSKAPNLT